MLAAIVAGSRIPNKRIISSVSGTVLKIAPTLRRSMEITWKGL
jgi:hypothetical protein